MQQIPLLISIVIPVYNEEENLEILYQEIRRTVDRLEKPYEIIFVDDGSTDETFERLKFIKQMEKPAQKPVAHMRIIRLSRNFGQTAAMQAGFDHAKGDIIVTLDGDLQNDPRDIPGLLTKLDEGYHIVCGWRKDRKDKTLTRILPSRVANWLIAMIIGIRIHDIGCTLKAYRRSVIESIGLYSDMHRFIPAIAAFKGANTAEITVNHRPRKYGKTKYSLSRVWKVLFDVITLRMLVKFYYSPMLWFFLFASIFFLVGAWCGIMSILQFLQGENTVIYPSTSFMLLTLSASFVLWGVLAEFSVGIESKLHSEKEVPNRKTSDSLPETNLLIEEIS
jgi:glycosyltransferase involved in cell wall biosynthesis